MKTTQPRRSRRSASEWASLVEESKTSTLPLVRFCEQANVSLTQFHHWRRKLRGGGAPVGGGFSAVHLRTEPRPAVVAPGGHIEVQLRNGRIVRVVGAVEAPVLREVILTAEGGA